ncbi:DUF4249 domain-containing protein [Pontibacter vulgaris]|uniref:DUF4249 domain-containing protein n=1 Tax=Pontibacter vulgaris TaxID=2905679 RepID=UPI001FA7E23F|nr:DUF4249 domain-containing protein [Pontibacter vulgaris]
MLTRKILFLLYLPLLLWSCTDIVELELPEQEPQLVVNSMFTPDSAWSVDISASQNALSNAPYEQVQNATVEVYQGSKYLFNLAHTRNGKYKSEEALPKALEHYTLKVSAPGFPACEASNFAPALPATRALKVARASSSIDPNIPEAEVSFVLDDAPNTQNYYAISAYFPDTAYTGEAYKNYVGLDFQAPIEQEFTMGNSYFFSDKLIDGKATTLKQRYTLIEGKTVYLNIAQISPDYYHYARTLVKQSYNDNFMTTPGPVHNNIRNGLGIFAGYNTVTYHIKH